MQLSLLHVFVCTLSPAGGRLKGQELNKKNNTTESQRLHNFSILQTLVQELKSVNGA